LTGNYNYFIVELTSPLIIPVIKLALPTTILLDAGVGAVETTAFTGADFVIKGCNMVEPSLLAL
jgi:hypothetical protein